MVPALLLSAVMTAGSGPPRVAADSRLYTERERYMENRAKEKSREYFNEHRKSRLARGGYWRRDYRYTLAEIEAIRPARLIDIGCGPGAFLCAVHERFPAIQLNALDLSEEMVRETAERLPDTAAVTAGDAENMPLGSGQYPVVTCNMSIHHYPHPQKAVDEMHRILTPDGVLLLNDMDCIAPIRHIANILFPRLPGGDVKMYRRDEIERMLAQAGFRDIRYRKISPFSFLCAARK